MSALCPSVCHSFYSSGGWRIGWFMARLKSLWAKDLNHGEKSFGDRSWTWPGGFEWINLINLHEYLWIFYKCVCMCEREREYVFDRMYVCVCEREKKRERCIVVFHIIMKLWACVCVCVKTSFFCVFWNCESVCVKTGFCVFSYLLFFLKEVRNATEAHTALMRGSPYVPRTLQIQLMRINICRVLRRTVGNFDFFLPKFNNFW